MQPLTHRKLKHTVLFSVLVHVLVVGGVLLWSMSFPNLSTSGSVIEINVSGSKGPKPIKRQPVPPVVIEAGPGAAPAAPQEAASAAGGGPIADLPAPEYPEVSRELNEEGSILLEVHFAADGSAEGAEILSSSSFARLDNAAKSAVAKIHIAVGVPGRTHRYRISFQLK